MIEVKNLTKSFNNKVLNDVSFSISKGESAAIIGKSGAGKSILLKCLNGLVNSDKGTIYIDNKLINSMNFRQLQEIRSQIGMVFQFGALFDSLNVGENISLALRKLTKLPTIDEDTRKLGTGGFSKKKINELDYLLPDEVDLDYIKSELD